MILFCQSCTSSSLSLVRLNIQVICTGLSQFLIQLDRFYNKGCKSSFQLLELCGIISTRCLFQHEQFTKVTSSLAKKAFNIALLTIALVLVYIIPVPHFSHSPFSHAALLIAFCHTLLFGFCPVVISFGNPLTERALIIFCFPKQCTFLTEDFMQFHQLLHSILVVCMQTTSQSPIP